MWKTLAFATAIFGAEPSSPTSAPIPPQTPAELMSALIGQFGDADLFTNITMSGSPLALAQHKTSGMRCLFDPRYRRNMLMVFNTYGAPRGDDVACQTMISGVLLTSYAMRYTPRVSPEAILARQENEIKQAYTDVRSAPPPSPDQIVPHPSDLKVVTSRYLVRYGQNELYTRLAIVPIGDWVLMVRASGIPANAPSIEGKVDALLYGDYDAMIGYRSGH